MAFRGHILPKWWNQVLNPLENSTRRVVERALGDQYFDNEFTYRTNGVIIGQFIAISIFAGKTKEEIIQVAREIFVEDNLGGLENMVNCVENHLTIPYLEIMMQTEIEKLDEIPQTQCIPMITFKHEGRFDIHWPEMLRNLDFLFHEILSEEVEMDWLLNYWRKEGFNIPRSLDQVKPSNLHIMVPEVTRCTQHSKKEAEDVECIVVMVKMRTFGIAVQSIGIRRDRY